MSSDVAAFLRPVLKRAQAGEHVEYERIGQNANGQRRWMHGRMAPDLFDGQGTRALLHRVRHPRPQADGAGARGARSSCGCSRTTSPNWSSISMPSAATYSSTRRSSTCTGFLRDQVLGKKPEEVLGVEGSQDLTPDRDRPVKNEALVYQRVVIDVVGRTRWIRARCVPDLHLDGTVRGEYVVGHDITDLKLAQDAWPRVSRSSGAIMDGVPAPVAYIDRDERCHYVNRTFLQYFGLTVEQVGTCGFEVVGQGIYERAGDAVACAPGRIDRVRSTSFPARMVRALDDDPRRGRTRAFPARSTVRSC